MEQIRVRQHKNRRIFKKKKLITSNFRILLLIPQSRNLYYHQNSTCSHLARFYNTKHLLTKQAFMYKNKYSNCNSILKKKISWQIVGMLLCLNIFVTAATIIASVYYPRKNEGAKEFHVQVLKNHQKLSFQQVESENEFIKRKQKNRYLTSVSVLFLHLHNLNLKCRGPHSAVRDSHRKHPRYQISIYRLGK